MISVDPNEIKVRIRYNCNHLPPERSSSHQNPQFHFDTVPPFSVFQCHSLILMCVFFQVPNTGSTKSCHRCRGTGGMTCRDCNGKGWSRCLNCHGDGWLHDSGGHRERCFYCQVRHGSSGFVVVICHFTGKLQYCGKTAKSSF